MQFYELLFRNYYTGYCAKILGSLFKSALLVLQVLSATLNGFINCACNHLTSFGGSLIVKPNPIDFDRVVVEFMLLHDTGNIAVIVTVSTIFLFYLIVIVVARKADKRDQKNVSIFNDVMKSDRSEIMVELER